MARALTHALPVLAVLSGAAGPVDWSSPQRVAVTMVDDRFVPDHLTFQHGIVYRLHLENHGKELHEFTAPAFFRTAMVRDPKVLANAGQEVVLQPGGSADVDFVPERAGQYDLTCADHDWDGMVGTIVVK